MLQTLRYRIQAAQKQRPADLVLKHGRVVNVFSNAIREQDIAVCDQWIAAVGHGYSGQKEIDLQGRWVVPGLMDGHIHIESSLLSPFYLAKELLCHGTTTIIADPHEIANVEGLTGIAFMLQNSQGIPFDVFFMAPSCVPATHLETSGATLTVADLLRLKSEPRILGLAEMMNYPGVLSGDEEVLSKIVGFQDMLLDGHAPLLHDIELQAYASAGIRSDHENQTKDEAIAKLESGLMIMVREGTSAKNLEAILPILTPENSRRFCLVADDLHPLSLQEQGHLDLAIRKSVRQGLNPITAVQLATLNPADYFGLKDRGAIAPGMKADLVILDDLEQFQVSQVFKNGRLAMEKGRVFGFPEKDPVPHNSKTFNLAPLNPETFCIKTQSSHAWAIELIPHQVLTRMKAVSVKAVNGLIVSDPNQDALKIAVLDRHRGSGNVGLGLVKGFGLKKGALASSVAHDSHNVIVTGIDDQDLFLAVKTVQEMGGGLAVVQDGRVLAKTPLEIAGLMTATPLKELASRLRKTEEAVRSLGCELDHPFMVLSFLALPVIPELKITDRGLVDVNRFEIISLFIRE